METNQCGTKIHGTYPNIMQVAYAFSSDATWFTDLHEKYLVMNMGNKLFVVLPFMSLILHLKSNRCFGKAQNTKHSWV